MGVSATGEIVASDHESERLSLANIYRIPADALREESPQANETPPAPPAKTLFTRDEHAGPGGPLDHARRQLPFAREKTGLWVLHSQPLDDSGWSYATRAGRGMGVRGVVSGLRYNPPSVKGLEIAPLELRVGKQPDMPHSKASIGARIAWKFE